MGRFTSGPGRSGPMPIAGGAARQRATPALRYALLAMVAMKLIAALPATAQTDAEPEPEQTNPRPAPPQSPIAVSDPAQSDQIEPEADVVITARYGEARVEAETEIDAAEIASYGADTVEEVLKRLEPLGAPGEDEPLILVNGKEVGFDRSILAYPPEALGRIGILRADAAAAYGQPSGRRVINLVLKRNFSSREGSVGAQWATRGGQGGESVTLGQVAIDGALRWNVQARLSRDGALLASDRDVPPRTGAIDLTGYVTGLDQPEIDPALSAAAGRLVTRAGLGGLPWQSFPTLADFVATADRTDPGDPRAFETLLPARRNQSLQLGVARPIGSVNAALNINASSSDSLGLRGLAMADLVLPVGNPWSPFTRDVRLVRPLAPGRALRQDSGSDSLGASLSLSARFGKWQTSLSASVARNWSGGLYERGVAIDAVQQRLDLDDAAFNPYAPFDATQIAAQRTRSYSETMSARLSVSRPLATLPAGPLTLSLSAIGSRNRTEQAQSVEPDGADTRDVRVRDQLSGQVAFGVPVSRGGKQGGGPLGDLGFDLTLGGQRASGSRGQKRVGAGVNWSPVAALRLRGGFEQQDVVPSFDQLDGAPVETVRRVYDIVRQETADVIWRTGGNPALISGSRQNWTLSALVRPLGSQLLSLNFAYRSRSGTGGIASFPELTPAVEAAFPERVIRDAAGRLVAVDARAINIARASEAELSSGIALRLPDPGAARARGSASGAQLLRLSVSVRHMLRLHNRILTRAGLEPLDLLRDAGQSRHQLGVQATLGNRSFGVDVDANWRSPSLLRNGGGAGPDSAVRFTQPVMVKLGIFVDPGDLAPAEQRSAFLKKLRLSLDIDNLFDRARRARRADGSVPPGYRRDEIDPLGRTIRLSVRAGF